MIDRTHTAITESTSWKCPLCGHGFNMSNTDWRLYIDDIIKYGDGKHWFYEFPYCSKRCKILNKLKESK